MNAPLKAPREGMITFIDAAATAARRSAHHQPGHCFRIIGFRDTEQRTTRGYHVLRLAPADFPLPRLALTPQASLNLRGAA